jgi:sugar O-acyltransferase (sialic acid O-acetyltransferase NeuD family)
MKKKFGIIGAGGHAKVVIEIIEEMGDTVEMVSAEDSSVNELLGYQVSHNLPLTDLTVLVAVGNNSMRKKVTSEITNGFGIAIHPKANLSARCSVGDGTVIMAGATINVGARIGSHCIINTNASIDHDCVMADFVHVSPGASLAGNVTVGEGTHIGIGSSIIQGVSIGKWATIGAGTVILRDVPDHAVVVGVPGKTIKYNKE